MTALRWIGIVGALLLMVGEAFRSWGVGRPVYAWMDEVLAGTIMIAAAIRVARPTVANRALFSAAWGIAVGMLYGSFFVKLFEPRYADAGNIPLGLLTALVGAAFVLAIGGLIASIVLPGETAA